jgi:LmbE family N-acetylglucosaminyl deacetylase
VPKTILAVFAHPDDESFTMAGTIAKYSKLGIKTILVTATFGQSGTKKHLKKGQNLADVRQKELEKCCKLLGIEKCCLLGYFDGQLHKVNQEELEQKISEIIKIHNPNIIITFGPQGVSGHVDHVAISSAATNCFKKLCDLETKRLLYVAPLEKHIRIKNTGLPSRLSATKAKTLHLYNESEVDVIIDISKFWQYKLDAMKCHFSQDDVRGFYSDIKKEPNFEECFILGAGKKFLRKPANNLFENL